MHKQVSDFIDQHKGETGYVVGKGKTAFDYALLGRVDPNSPVFFINDAVLLEKHLRPAQPSFMTFLDHHQRLWTQAILKSVVLCPHEHSPGAGPNVVFYQKDPDITKLIKQPGTPLYVSRGTVCTLLSFAWLTGVSRIIFIGCDGVNDSSKAPYDPRIPNPSGGTPNWEYDAIRKAQEATCRSLRLPFEYLGTPKQNTPTV
jgi:hypothetical protein